MRCDGNVSLRRRGETKLGTKTELKNLNSFKSLHDGLAYEICRQAEVLEEGGIIYQETRHWEPSRKRTVVMRVKETADDYRLFPGPMPSAPVLRPTLALRRPTPSRLPATPSLPSFLRPPLPVWLARRPRRLQTCW